MADENRLEASGVPTSGCCDFLLILLFHLPFSSDLCDQLVCFEIWSCDPKTQALNSQVVSNHTFSYTPFFHYQSAYASFTVSLNFKGDKIVAEIIIGTKNERTIDTIFI